MLPVARYPLLVSALVAGGCLFPTDPNDAVSVEIELSTTDVWAPDGVTITVRLINHSSTTIRYETCGDIFGYIVRSVTDTTVMVPPPFGCFWTRATVLAPRDTLVRTEHRSLFLGWRAGRYHALGYLALPIMDSRLRRTRFTEPVDFTLTCRRPEWPTC